MCHERRLDRELLQLIANHLSVKEWARTLALISPELRNILPSEFVFQLSACATASWTDKNMKRYEQVCTSSLVGPWLSSTLRSLLNAKSCKTQVLTGYLKWLHNTGALRPSSAWTCKASMCVASVRWWCLGLGHQPASSEPCD